MTYSFLYYLYNIIFLFLAESNTIYFLVRMLSMVMIYFHSEGINRTTNKRNKKNPMQASNGVWVFVVHMPRCLYISLVWMKWVWVFNLILLLTSPKYYWATRMRVAELAYWAWFIMCNLSWINMIVPIFWVSCNIPRNE